MANSLRPKGVSYLWFICSHGFAEPSVSSKQTNGSALFVCFEPRLQRDKQNMEEPHIGHIIKQVLHEQGRTITWLGKQLGCSRQNIYKILSRPWIYTDMLLKISDLLDYDFFRCFSECHKEKYQLKNN